MAKNPRFNNKSLFSDVTDEGTENIVLNSTSETLATQGNVINSLKKFWNNLREKLAYSVTRTGTANAVGDDYTPVYVNENGEVYPCNAGMITASINGSGNVTSDLIKTSHTGVIIYLSIDGNAAANPNGTRTLSVAGYEVKYPTGVAVLAREIAVGSLLLLAYAKSSNSGFWVLLNKVNTVNGTNAGLMTVAEHNKLANIADNANNYSLPIAGSNLGGVKSAATGNTAGRDYNVQINSDGTMKVNVPWTDTQPTHYTALLKAGGLNSKENQNTTNGNTYLQVVENGNISSQLNIKGTKGVTVSSSSSGVVTIEGQGSTPILLTAGSYQNWDDTTGYLVLGPGYGNNNDHTYLRGDGSWGPVAPSMGKMTASITNGAIDMGSNLNAALHVTYNGRPIQFAFINSTYKVSSLDGSLYISGVKASSTINSDSTALIVPMGNLSLKPQVLHFISQTEVEFLD